MRTSGAHYGSEVRCEACHMLQANSGFTCSKQLEAAARPPNKGLMRLDGSLGPQLDLEFGRWGPLSRNCFLDPKSTKLKIPNSNLGSRLTKRTRIRRHPWTPKFEAMSVFCVARFRTFSARNGAVNEPRRARGRLDRAVAVGAGLAGEGCTEYWLEAIRLEAIASRLEAIVTRLRDS